MSKWQAYAEKWECRSCDALHDDEDAARECCEPEVRAVLVCTACEKRFGQRKTEEAASCHPDEAPIKRCLCGNVVDEKDEGPSFVLGSLVWCADCRTQIESGVPAPVARDRTFAQLAGGGA